MKLISWNIDSLNAALTSDSARAKQSREVLATIIDENPDIIAIQETKLSATGPTKKHQTILAEQFPDYEIAWRSSQEPARKGYAGTMFLYKNNLNPTISYPDYLVSLDQNKPLLSSGDFNVAHKEIDLAHPGNNHHSAGFTDEERAGFTNLLNKGFTDTFRYVHGDVKDVYSWWAQRSRTSKINNSGWRIDYWLASNRIADKIVRSEMLDSGERRDHTPIVLEINI